jgi:flagellar biosynthetic protein FliQ
LPVDGDDHAQFAPTGAAWRIAPVVSCTPSLDLHREIMTPESVMSIGQQALLTMLLVSAPVLLAALVIGLLISVFQAATQINEMTLSFIPKLVGVFFTLVVAGPWMTTVLVDYVRRLFSSIPGIIG